MEEQTLTAEQALENLAQVAQVYKGTAQEHQLLSKSVGVLMEVVKKAKPALADPSEE